MATATNNTMPTLDEFRTRLKRHGLKATRASGSRCTRR